MNSQENILIIYLMSNFLCITINYFSLPINILKFLYIKMFYKRLDLIKYILNHSFL